MLTFNGITFNCNCLIRKDNTIKWNWILIGALITLALVIAGVCGLDKVVYSLIHQTDCNAWSYDRGILCTAAVILGKIFSTKMWVILSALSVVGFFLYKAIRNENDFRYAFVKIKNKHIKIKNTGFPALFNIGTSFLMLS